MNFLELAQMAARESGTVSGVLPAAVTAQTGRLAKFVHWTNSAWLVIQNRREDWFWMRAEFAGAEISGVTRYTGAGWSLARFARWRVDPPGHFGALTAYPTATGPINEGDLIRVPWDYYMRQWLRGPERTGRPREYAVSPSNELCLGPVPDADYTIRGEYYKGPQTLVAAGDTPEMPARFHEMVAHYALLLMAEHDEAGLHIAVAQRRYREILSDLERDQLPQICIAAGAIA